MIEVLHSSDTNTPTNQNNFVNERQSQGVAGNCSKHIERQIEEGRSPGHCSSCQISITWPQTQIPLNDKAQLFIFEDNEAVIKMIIKGRSPMMRRVSRILRVALDWLFDGIN